MAKANLRKDFPFDPRGKPEGTDGPVVCGHPIQSQIFGVLGVTPFLKVANGQLYWFYNDPKTGDTRE